MIRQIKKLLPLIIILIGLFVFLGYNGVLSGDFFQSPEDIESFDEMLELTEEIENINDMNSSEDILDNSYK